MDQVGSQLRKQKAVHFKFPEGVVTPTNRGFYPDLYLDLVTLKKTEWDMTPQVSFSLTIKWAIDLFFLV